MVFLLLWIGIRGLFGVRTMIDLIGKKVIEHPKIVNIGSISAFTISIGRIETPIRFPPAR